MQDFRRLLPQAYYPFFERFRELRPAQEQAILPVLAEKNVLLISPTGSGKTEAVVAPLAEKAVDQREILTCLYICPTRALVNDIERRIESPLNRMQLKVGVRHGDRKTKQGKRAPEFLITTPESLDVMLGNNRYRSRLEGVQTVIVDEVHQFFQTHRGYQLLILLERLKWWTKKPLQRLLLSATVAQPEEMARWFHGSDSEFEIITIPGGRKLQVSFELVTAEDGEKFRGGESIFAAIQPISGKHDKVLVFANSRNECNWLAWRLGQRLKVPTFLHYSSLDRKYREDVERRFQQSPRAICIATSTLELGVDIGDVDAIIMYGAPSSISSFVQRVGRGNRREEICNVYGFCREYHVNGTYLGADNDLIILCALVGAMQDSELETRPDASLFSVLVQQLFSLTSRWGSIIPGKLMEALEGAQREPIASSSQVTMLLDFLTEQSYYTLRQDTKEYYKAEKWDFVRYTRQLWGNIASQAYDSVFDASEDIRISEIPRGQAKSGEVFLVAGRPRLITEVTGNVVRTIKLDTEDPEFVAYETSSAATPIEVAEKAAELLFASPFPNLPLYMDDTLSPLMTSYRQRFAGFPLNRAVPFERKNGRFCYYTFGGSWAQELLAISLRKLEYKVLDADSWRIFTNRSLQELSQLPATETELTDLVLEELPYFIHRMAFSYHFHQLPSELQHKEVCSLLNLPRVANWLDRLRVKELQELPAE